MKDPYAVLGVPRDASDAQIRYAYRQAMREQTSGESPVEVKERQDEVEEAYQALTDPRRRRGDGATAAVQTPEREPAPTLPVLEEAEEKRPRNPFTRMTHKLPRPWRIALDWVLTIAGAVLIVLAIKAWVVNPYRIPSSSMEPTLHCARSDNVASGCEARFSDRVLANRFIFHFRNPHRGEIVVFDVPELAEARCGAGGVFVKRIVGLPGELWEERHGYVYINGKRLTSRTSRPTAATS